MPACPERVAVGLDDPGGHVELGGQGPHGGADQGLGGRVPADIEQAGRDPPVLRASRVEIHADGLRADSRALDARITHQEDRPCQTGRPC